MHRSGGTSPQRTCIGCRRRDDKSALLRLVQVDRDVAVDPGQSAPGRGAYLHRRAACVDLAIRRRTVGGALRAAVPDQAQLARVVQPHLETEVGST